jgi:DNA-binding response OmpR family regulator
MSAISSKILIVDDDQDVLIALERLLEDQGYRTVTAWSGQEALSLLNSQSFDLLLLDRGLPDLDSAEVLRRARAGRPTTSCIMLRGTEAQTSRVPSYDVVCKWEHPEILDRVRDSLTPEKISRSSSLMA